MLKPLPYMRIASCVAVHMFLYVHVCTFTITIISTSMDCLRQMERYEKRHAEAVTMNMLHSGPHSRVHHCGMVPCAFRSVVTRKCP